MPDAPMLLFKKWRPDLTPIGTDATPTAQNVIPRGDGYGPFQSLLPFTQSLLGPCRGAFYARNPDGSVNIFAATATNIYVLNSTTFAWVSVGGPYTSIPATDNFQFIQYNNLVIAVQQNMVPQVFTLPWTGSNTFSALGGSPPQASHITVINQFIVLTGIVGFPYRVQWSDVANPTNWSTGLANQQDFGDGGIVRDIKGGDQYGITFQDSAIRSMIFQPGSQVIFQFVKIASLDGALGQYASVNAGDKIFYYSPQGFKKIESGGYPTPIGKEFVDRTFLADIDVSNLQLFIAITDPASTRVYWMYKSQSGSTGLADKVLIYDWALDEWATLVGQSIEYLFYMYKPGLTLEGLDSIVPGQISILSAANNGGGLIRLQLSGLSAGTPPENFNLGTLGNQLQNTIEIYNATGGVPNGNFRFNIIDTTHIDLVGSTFTSTGTGTIGGSLDQLGVSLDSFGPNPLPQFAGFTSAHASAFFNGPNLQAVLETPTQDLGQRFRVNFLRPITDAPGCIGALGVQDTPQQSLAYTTPQTINAVGRIPVKVETRYARAQLTIPAGTTWTYARGIKPIGVVPGGER